jgi:hypothetical protein
VITRRNAILLGGAAVLPAKAPGLRIGIAETTITPSWPTLLWGYDRPNGPSTGVLDDIYAKAMMFDSGRKLLVITTDIGSIGLDLSRRIAARIGEATGIPEDAVAIQCTHTHAAPAVLDVTLTPADRKYQDLLEERMVAIAKQAQANLAPAVLELGQVASSIALNRRYGNRENTWDKDSGPIESTFSVLLARSPGGKNLGVLVNYPTHPVALRNDNYKISADFPGVMYKRLGAAIHCPVLYMQGCCGDMIPKVFGTVKEMESYGVRMAEEALRAMSVARPISAGGADYKAKRIALDYVAPYSLAEFRARAAELSKGSDMRHEWAKLYQEYLEKGGAPKMPHETMVAAFRLGELHMALLPGEVLHLTSVLIRAQFPGAKLLVGSYANDVSTGYLPHAVEFPRGGYEVDTAWQLYGVLKTTPAMEQSVRETAVELLRATGAAE